MAITALYDPQSRQACLICTTTDTAFGPVFEGVDDADQMQRFLHWMEVQWGGIEGTDDELRDRFARFRIEDGLKIEPGLICPSCAAVLAASSPAPGEALCPNCQAAEVADFEEVDLCAACGGVVRDRGEHVKCGPPASKAGTRKKPPAESLPASLQVRTAG